MYRNWRQAGRCRGFIGGFVLLVSAWSCPVWAQTEGQAMDVPESADDRQLPADPLLALPPGRNENDPLVSRQRGEPSGKAVLGRSRSDYDPLGIKLDGFTLFPTITLSGGATDNARSGEDAVFASFRAAAAGRSDWSRHQLAFDGFFDTRRYTSLGSENGSSWALRTNARVDVHGRNAISAEVTTQRVITDRGSVGEFVNTRRPTRYRRNTSAVAAHFFSGRLGGRVDLEYQHQNFDDVAVGGIVIDQDFRDAETYEAGLELDYHFGAPRSLFFSARQAWRRFDLERIPSRDVEILEIIAGIESEITPLLHGRFGVGYLRANFDNPEVQTQDGIALDASLRYLISELSTVNLSARRSIQNIASPQSPGAVLTRVQLGVDHELLRNVIVSAAVLHDRANYIASPRRDRLIGADLGANYFINRRWRASLRATARRRTSKNVLIEEFLDERRYRAVTVTAGVTFQI